MSKKIVIELDAWQVERMRGIVNALKNFNRTTDDKADISYDLICELDDADRFIANHIGLEQIRCEHGHMNLYVDYTWTEEKTDG